MQSPESDGIAAYLEHGAGAAADPARLAEKIVATCRAIDDALSPIVGHRGVAALYRRSVHLASEAHPWLARAHEGTPTALDLAPLAAVLAQQSGAQAVAGGTLLLQTFHSLLTTLVGPSLTERLLRPVWATFLSGPSAQDTTP
ncbi:MAG: hypothetical protein V4540_02945 [Pseudomonadota bacterium]